MIDLVYILGHGHSGSTLLDMLLGSHPIVFSLGEMRYFDDWRVNNDLCTCGKSFQECKFWSQILSQFDKPTDYLLHQNLSVFGKGQRFLIDLAIHRTSSDLSRFILRLAPNVYQQAKNAENLYQTIRKCSKASVLIDSSKSIRHGGLLYALQPESTKMIYLTRDGRGWFASQLKRTTLTPTQLAISWLRQTQQTETFLSTLPNSAYIHVLYEQICRETEDTIRSLCDFISIPYEDRIMDFRQIEHHNIGGNPMRLKSQAEIREDVRWRADLTAEMLEIFETICGSHNRKLLGKYFIP